MTEMLEAATSYLAALFMLLWASSDEILQAGGLLLLVVRLIADAPRAVTAIKSGVESVKERRKRKRSGRTSQ